MEEKYSVYLRNKESGEIAKTLMENVDCGAGYQAVNEYNKGYGSGKELRKTYPIEAYEVEIRKVSE